jgi:hypothetical protein
MVFSDTLNEQGIIQDIDFLVTSDDSVYPIKDKTRNINKALDRVAFLIQTADKKWQFEDVNEVDLPIATTNLVAGQRDYSIDTAFLEILKVAVKDSAGNFHIIPQTDVYDADYRAMMLIEDNPIQGQGIPCVYDLHGNSIFLDPVTNYSIAEGLKVWLKRNIQYFTPSDTTKVPGFNPQFHRYLSLSASYDYAMAKGLKEAQSLRQEMINMEQAISQHYSLRNKDKPIRLAFRATRSE